MKRAWWMEAVGYQVYLKSFYDSNDDGIGDLMGLYEKLDYLNELGINLIWISPFFVSPMDDNGYDISNHYNVDPIYGTLDDFKRVVSKAKNLGIKIILDYVLNHTSDEHQWFLESRKNAHNKYSDYYIWEAPRIIDQNKYPPTNWASFFGGSAWQYDEVRQMYFMKIFSNKMPDLNWKNPDVLNELVNVGKFWLDLGIDGFRIDAISHLGRAEYEDSPYGNKSSTVLDMAKFSNLPEVVNYTKELKSKLFNDDVLTIGEMGGNASMDYTLKFTNFDDQLISMVFNFDHNWCNNIHDINSFDELKTDSKRLKEVLSKWQYFYLDKGWLPLNWLNHDQPRLASHYGSFKYPFLSQSMLATLNYFQRGTPFIYQGEEIGTTGYQFKSLKEFRDISSINYYQALKNETNLSDEEIAFKVSKTSRDQARLPMQWDNSKYGGFSNRLPWISVNPNKDLINVLNQQQDPNSLWYYYQKIIQLRKNSLYKELIVYGDYEMFETNDYIYSYKRAFNGKILIVVCSFLETTQTYDLLKFKAINTILSNSDDNKLINNNQSITLSPFGAVVLDVKEK